MRRTLLSILVLGLTVVPRAGAGEPTDIFARSNLVAWCIVPFDAKKRGPEERAAMLASLGLRRFAYDYRAEHVPTFDAEVEALQRHGIELTAWWFPTSLNDEARHILDVLHRHGLKPQLWVMGDGGERTASPAEQAARIEAEAQRIRPIADAAAKIGCAVALYNHDHWFGEPENQLAIIERLARDGVTNVGIVYNLHHGHAHLDRFATMLEKIKPHLLALNLNGTTRDGDRKGQLILPLGEGEYDLEILRVIRETLRDWQGPIGILNHTDEDAEARLRDNLDGLDWLLPQLDGKPAGPKPQPRSWRPALATTGPAASVSPAFGHALANGLVVDNRAEFRAPPITVECWAKLMSHASYNILVASDTKASGAHWEMFTMPGTGALTAYLPGLEPDHVHSSANVCDGQWHHLAMIYETERVRLFVDGAEVAATAVKSKGVATVPGKLAFGRLVEGGIGCDGLIDDVRISRGARDVRRPDAPAQRDAATLGLWNFDELAAAPPSPAPFIWNNAPLQPELWPNRLAPPNRDRLYDYYTKEARHFLGVHPMPALLPEFPGLDAGAFGHWGKQNENAWRDARWQATDYGSLMSGVFRGGGLTVNKAVCVRLGEQGDWAACFDPELLDFRIVWRGGFVGVGDTRHGFMNGLELRGEVVEKFATPAAPPTNSVYRGLYRHGGRVIFSYTQNGVAMLDAATIEEGRFVRQRGPAATHPLRDLCRGGPPQWPQVLETRGQRGTGGPYAVDTLTLPAENPWRTLFFVSDHDFFSNGDIALCTMVGDVWRVSGVDDSLARLRWKRLATGLHQPLGLVVVDDKVCVLGRDQITRLHDLNGDGEADFYECLANGYVTSPGGHDFICGLQRDAAGWFYFASGNQGVCRIVPGGVAEVIATGFRNPNGLGLAADGTLTTSVQEGEWTPASAVCQLKPGGFYGYGGPRSGVTTEPPLVYLPRGLDNSSAGQVFVTSKRWGPLAGQLLHFSFGACTHFLVLRETVAGQPQGAVVELPGDFLSGAQRGRFSPRDGQLYVSGMTGWGTYAVADGCLQRVRYTGGAVQLPVAIATHDNGVLLTFAEPLDRSVAGLATNHFAQCWNYRYSSAYGSPEFSVRYPETPGHDPLEVTSATVLADGRTVFLEIPQLVPANVVQLHVASGPDRAHDVFLTAHRLGQPFTNFPGYRAIAKLALPHDHLHMHDAALAVAAAPNPWAAGATGRAMRIESAEGLRFSVRELFAKPGERLSLTFANPDVMPHNWTLLKPGSLERVGELVNKFVADPRAAARQYVPESPDVLAYTDIVPPGGKFTIHFTAPAQPGDYPYLCTFPGHWQIMNGVLKVSATLPPDGANPSSPPAAGKAGMIATLPLAEVLNAVATQHGDVALGARLFTQQGCVACHTVRPGDPLKGPYLGASALIHQRRELAENILLPDKAIAPGFEAVQFTLKDETVTEGFVTSETTDAVTVRMITGQVIPLPTADIAHRAKREHSMMPEGLVANLTVPEFVALLDFVESLPVK